MSNHVPRNPEEAEQQLRIDLAEYEADIQRSLEALKSSNASGLEAIKASTLINGGAAVAVLAFIGHLASIHADASVIMNFARPLRLFVAGALFGVVASGVTYLVRRIDFVSLKREFTSKEARRGGNEDLAAADHESSVKWGWWAEGLNFIVILIVAASLVCFGCGCYTAYRVFESGITTPPAPPAWTNCGHVWRTLLSIFDPI
jgi:hypothetical protein